MVPTFTLVMTIGIDEGIYSCDQCGSLVPYGRFDLHVRDHMQRSQTWER